MAFAREGGRLSFEACRIDFELFVQEGHIVLVGFRIEQMDAGQVAFAPPRGVQPAR